MSGDVLLFEERVNGALHVAVAPGQGPLGAGEGLLDVPQQVGLQGVDPLLLVAVDGNELHDLHTEESW